MVEFFRRLFSSDFMPHGHCYFWQPEIVWLHVISDALIALAYYSIPVTLLYFVRKRRDAPFHWIFILFASFILACGTTHLLSIWTLWIPTYRLDGVVKLFTGVISIITAVALYPLVPKALALPRPSELREANAALESQVQERLLAERAVQKLNAELEERVRVRTAELERSNSDLQQFAYVASHDLQEPLRLVSTHTQLAARRLRGKVDEDTEELLTTTIEGAQRMQRLVADLLQYSRVDREELALREISSEVALAAALQSLALARSENDALITSNRLPMIVGEPDQIALLLQNLIENAIKYRSSSEPRIHISAKADGDRWQFSVTDNGIGISAENCKSIFTVFKRLHGREIPGSGIGLATCEKIVSRHGGRIWVESEVGRGSTFYFTLPQVPGTDKK
jgi:signal transduction histidine kinase